MINGKALEDIRKRHKRESERWHVIHSEASGITTLSVFKKFGSAIQHNCKLHPVVLEEDIVPMLLEIERLNNLLARTAGERGEG